jgi:integrase
VTLHRIHARQVPGQRLYALFHLVALRGLRRGEVAGLAWSDLDQDAGTLSVSGQLQQLGGRVATAPPKSDAGRRVIAPDRTTTAALREHKARQEAERDAAAGKWTESGFVFATLAGKPVGSDRLTRVFRKLVTASGLAPVTLHGLRHGAAELTAALLFPVRIPARKPAIRQARGRPLPARARARARHHRNQHYAA